MRKAAKLFGLAIVCMLIASALSIVSVGNVEKGIKSPETVWLQGYTVDETCAPVANITIWAYGGDPGNYTNVTSDVNGEYNFTALNVGNYSLVAWNETQGLLSRLTLTLEANTSNYNITVRAIPAKVNTIEYTFRSDYRNLTAEAIIEETYPLVYIEELGIANVNQDGIINASEAENATAHLSGLWNESTIVGALNYRGIPVIDDQVFSNVSTEFSIAHSVPTGIVTDIVAITGTLKANYTNESVPVANEHTVNLTVLFDTAAGTYIYSLNLLPMWRAEVYDASVANVTIIGWTPIEIDPLLVTDTSELVSIKVIEDDVAPADIATNLEAVAGETNVTLTWTAINATLVPDFDHYNVYKCNKTPEWANFTLVGDTTETTYLVTDLTHELWYFAVTTVDVVGNENVTLVTSAAVPNKAPVANFTISPLDPHPGVEVTFNASISSDPDDDALNYTWNISGVIKYGVVVTHTFTTLDTFDVILTVTDTMPGVPEFVALSASKSDSVTTTNQAPTASFEVSATEVFVGEEITFTSTSTDPEDDTLTYLWDFGDGATSTEAAPKHAYAAAGTYNVTLKVTDAYGAEHTSPITTITVKEKPIEIWLYAAIIIIIIIIIIIAAVVAIRKKKGPEAAVPPETKE